MAQWQDESTSKKFFFYLHGQWFLFSVTQSFYPQEGVLQDAHCNAAVQERMHKKSCEALQKFL
jgi:hypothetical protein